jgi:hypothetical protein
LGKSNPDETVLLDFITPREDDVLPLRTKKEFHSISGLGLPQRDAAPPKDISVLDLPGRDKTHTTYP